MFVTISPILTKNSVVVYMLWFQTDVVSVNNETIVANASYILYGARWTVEAFNFKFSSFVIVRCITPYLVYLNTLVVTSHILPFRLLLV